MSNSIKINLDLTNPGQFFACCGLHELADRIWPETKAMFDKNAFCLLPPANAADATADKHLVAYVVPAAPGGVSSRTGRR